jgi:large subunit ribosomal protein L30
MAQPQQKIKAIAGKLHVTLVKSVIGTKESHRACVRGLGLRRLNHTVIVEDTPAVRGMINKVYYLVKCEA